MKIEILSHEHKKSKITSDLKPKELGAHTIIRYRLDKGAVKTYAVLDMTVGHHAATNFLCRTYFLNEKNEVTLRLVNGKKITVKDYIAEGGKSLLKSLVEAFELRSYISAASYYAPLACLRMVYAPLEEVLEQTGGDMGKRISKQIKNGI